MRFKVKAIPGVHEDFMLTLRPGYIALVGPNGAGKSALLDQIHRIADAKGCDVIHCDTYRRFYDAFAKGYISSAIKIAKENNSVLFILLDNIDKQQNLYELFQVLERDMETTPAGGPHEIFILAAANGYELAKGKCLNVRTGETKVFGSYEEYRDFLCNFPK